MHDQPWLGGRIRAIAMFCCYKFTIRRNIQLIHIHHRPIFMVHDASAASCSHLIAQPIHLLHRIIKSSTTQPIPAQKRLRNLIVPRSIAMKIHPMARLRLNIRLKSRRIGERCCTRLDDIRAPTNRRTARTGSAVAAAVYIILLARNDEHRTIKLRRTGRRIPNREQFADGGRLFRLFSKERSRDIDGGRIEESIDIRCDIAPCEIAIW